MTDYYYEAGYDDGIKKAIDILKERDSDGRKSV